MAGQIVKTAKKMIIVVGQALEDFKLAHAKVLLLTGTKDPYTAKLIKDTEQVLSDIDAECCHQCGHWFPNDDLATIVVHDVPHDATEDSDRYYHDARLCKECHENPIEETQVR